MNVLVTGYAGYIGTVLTPMLLEAGHRVTGLDSDFFAGCDFTPNLAEIPAIHEDVRDVTVTDLHGFDAVIHLAALSNDPLSDLNPECTYEINHRASVRLAELAKAAGVPRFLFSSSCSLYGRAAEADFLTEEASFNPVTPYGESKVLVERDVSRLADDNFSPTYLRNSTAYGVSPRLRADLVVNNLVGFAFTTGEVLIASDGTPWRPLVHVQDICQAFIAVLNAPKGLVHNQAFNVGRTQENYQIRDVASMVQEIVPRSRVRYAEGGGPDLRCYRVNCDKIAQTLPDFRPQWTVRRGIEQLYKAYKEHGLALDEFRGERYTRIKHLKSLLSSSRLDPALRWNQRAPSLSQRQDHDQCSVRAERLSAQKNESSVD
jgi:nucleoside-diphosphate-sugar epimerase